MRRARDAVLTVHAEQADGCSARSLLRRALACSHPVALHFSVGSPQIQSSGCQSQAQQTLKPWRLRDGDRETRTAHRNRGHRTRVCSQAPPPLPRTLPCQEAVLKLSPCPIPPGRKELRSPGRRPAPAGTSVKGGRNESTAVGCWARRGLIHARRTQCPGRAGNTYARDAPRRSCRVPYPHGPGRVRLRPESYGPG